MRTWRRGRKEFVHGLVLLSTAALFIFLQGCAGNCSGPDVNGAYTCTEEDSGGGWASGSDDDGGGQGGGSYDEDDDDDGSIIADIFVALMESDEDEKDAEARSCEPMPADYDCHSRGRLPVKISAETGSADGDQPVRVDYYEGYFEDGRLLGSTYGENTVLNKVLSEGLISAAALYIIDRDTILAVDGAKVKASSEEFCERTCWSAGDVRLDLRLTL